MRKPCPDNRRALALHVVGELTRTEHDEISGTSSSVPDAANTPRRCIELRNSML